MKRVYDYNAIFITYNEPNGEDNWNKLIESRRCNGKPPKELGIHRLDGVKGFDASIKAAANLSETDRFFIIDGDNVVQDRFWNQEFEPVSNEMVYSWSSRNYINGLIYGNSGIKSWTKTIAMDMQTHENDPDGHPDFYWDVPYMQMNDWFSTNVNNCTPLQAFQAGFREGIKLSLIDDYPADSPAEINGANLRRLKTWMSLGRDIENGEWSMFGARLGFELIFYNQYDLSELNDYEDFRTKFKNNYRHDYDRVMSRKFEDSLALDHGVDVVDLSSRESRFIKQILTNPPRRGMMITDNGENNQFMRNNFMKQVV